MFENLSNRLSDVFDRLKRRGALTEDDVNAALREVRIALLEADVALPVVKEFVAGVRERAVGQEVLRSITPGQQVVKVVNDRLVELLGGETSDLQVNAAPPMVVLMVGLQGSGKTTTSAKIGLRLRQRHRKKVLLASLDVRRPAAQEQLAVLARQAGVEALPIVPGQGPIEITRRALDTARREGYDALILDTAGRLHIDDELMAEVEAVRDLARPHETLLVADALTGQDAVRIADEFNKRVGVTGMVLTRLDGDARGGAALSMRAVTGKPIKLAGMGEKLEALEPFHPDRLASRILGMGDVVSLVERAAETIDREEAERLARKVQKGGFDLEDYAKQLGQVKKMGGLGGMLGMLPGIGKLQKQLAGAQIDDSIVVRQTAIIGSMTRAERRNIKLLNASRRRRIAAGSGTSVQEVNQLVKQFQQMQGMMKRVRKMGDRQQRLFGRGGGLPPGTLPPGMMPPR